jgi:hypothetical protein
MVVSISKSIKEKINTFKRFSNGLKFLPSHSAYFLLKKFFINTSNDLLLTLFPLLEILTILLNMTFLKETLKDICNCSFNENSWSQSTLPVSLGGLGFRKLTSLCYSSFLGSIHGVAKLLLTILPAYISQSSDTVLVEALCHWSKLSRKEPINSVSQRDWDMQICLRNFDTLSSNTENLRNKARLLATQQKAFGAWLNCLPSSSLGTLLDDSSFRIAVALRTCQHVCEPHTCICGKPADKFGHHGLSCRKSTGRHSRHGNINDIIKRALVSAEIPSILEPTGCCRSDGKRADGTLERWQGSLMGRYV